MILPTKHIPIEESLLGLSAEILSFLSRPRTVTALWEIARDRPVFGSFHRFSLALDLLFLIGVIDIESGWIQRTKR
jgi:hypothetical protein